MPDPMGILKEHLLAWPFKEEEQSSLFLWAGFIANFYICLPLHFSPFIFTLSFFSLLIYHLKYQSQHACAEPHL